MKFDLNINIQKPKLLSRGSVFTQAMKPLVRDKKGCVFFTEALIKMTDASIRR